MKHISHVSIPDPCTQNWDNMLRNTQGKFCDSCQKTVTDFTALSNTEILGLLSASSNLCGRFGPSQLNNLNSELAPTYRLPAWQKVGLVASLISLLPFIAAKAQVKQPIGHHKATKPLVGTIVAKIALSTITGNVVDSASNQAIALVGINVNGSQSHVLTDSLGNFRIEISPEIDTVLIISTIGYQVYNIKLNKNQANYSVRLAAQELTLAPVEALITLVGGISVKRSFLWTTWYRIKHPFKSIFK
ncbi:MAG: carboxypeptidase-like regulatory domain-containing protein [Mucilaginibacter sp.]|uniref:carboxypeptidase-like regulatory domain-containing protein n=1 Tax=Mucilaginibacter sp. TaxID=1882438 RepID=UPI003265BF3D